MLCGTMRGVGAGALGLPGLERDSGGGDSSTWCSCCGPILADGALFPAHPC